MTVDELREISLKMPCATEEIKWQSHLCFFVGGKMFLITSPNMLPSTSAFKVPAEEIDELTSQTGFTKHFALGRHGWVHLDGYKAAKKERVGKIYKTVLYAGCRKIAKENKKTVGVKNLIQLL